MPERDDSLFDKELAAQLQAMTIPAADERFEQRIIAQAMAQAGQDTVQVHQGSGFAAWWNAPRIAIAAAIAAVALLVLSPVEQFTSTAPQAMQVAQVEERYTVDGVPLLADVDVLEEDKYLELAYADLGAGYSGN